MGRWGENTLHVSMTLLQMISLKPFVTQGCKKHFFLTVCIRVYWRSLTLLRWFKLRPTPGKDRPAQIFFAHIKSGQRLSLNP